MTRSVLASGTQTATINTEHTLQDDTSNEGHVIDGKIDLTNMVSGDVTTITLYEKALAGGALVTTYIATFTGAQVPVMLQILPLTEAKEWKLTLKQTVGTGRNYNWTVYSD